MRFIEYSDFLLIREFLSSANELTLFDIRLGVDSIPYTHLHEEDSNKSGIYTFCKNCCITPNEIVDTANVWYERHVCMSDQRYIEFEMTSLKASTFGRTNQFTIRIIPISDQESISKYTNEDAMIWPTGYELDDHELRFYGIYDIDNIKPMRFFLDFSITKIET